VRHGRVLRSHPRRRPHVVAPIDFARRAVAWPTVLLAVLLVLVVYAGAAAVGFVVGVWLVGR
jgi:hypothetical protein